jgi:hypothetical protein
VHFVGIIIVQLSTCTERQQLKEQYREFAHEFRAFVMLKGKENCTSRPGPVRRIQETIIGLLRVTAARPVVCNIADVFCYSNPDLSNYFYTILWKLKSQALWFLKSKKFSNREIKPNCKIKVRYCFLKQKPKSVKVNFIL